ncbi:stage V sporulation protein AC [Vallitalea okinawensis]|uniref:stage V sporulation protein AC n=1 Tax=Vallitalea okinawensis TaxID=2078660 RepID=UPI000CFA93E2|nr:stage V sporulation protein AC [Vallitalea okinawensis]
MVGKDQQKAKDYQTRVEQVSPKHNSWVNCFRAFLVGGTICCIGQFITDGLINYGFEKGEAATITSIVLVFFGALFTGLDIYDNIAKFAGAGTVVPITGFANSIVASAIEFKKEGYVFGVGSKMFTIAGPVIVYGVISSVAVGLIYLFMI